MFARGFQFDFLESRCSSCHPHLFILASEDQVPVMCGSTNLTSKYQHCRLHPDGVHDLDCFGRYTNRGKKECVWKPGNHTSEKIYTLVQIQQSVNYCKIHNKTPKSSKIIMVFGKLNLTVVVFENGESEKCTKAVFSGSPSSLLRCDPPSNVSFRRRLGNLHVNVSWQKDAVNNYSVRYKMLVSRLWIEPPVQSQNGTRCTVENLNSSLFYTVQIQCVTTAQCSQCPWSETYTVPSELTAQPVIVNLEDSDIAEKKGSRLFSLHWKFPATESYDGYYVTIAKASGEAPFERMSTTRPEIRLILSFSSYHLNISAVNNASISPAVSHTIPQREDVHTGIVEGKLNVTVHSNTSFTVYWKDDLIKTYVCFSVEWMRKRHKAAAMSFYQKAHNWRTLSPLQEPLKPFKRYSLTLHTRPNKDTCNIKYINRSESTYGTTQFYSIQGSPVSAPNISISNITWNSVVLQWSSIPEDDIQGFLLGYMIHYTEYHHRGTSTERNIQVDPQLDTYELGHLEGGTACQVQISGFTQAGAGVRSTAVIFTTSDKGYFHYYLNGYIIPIAVVVTVLFFASIMIKRAKVILWPSIPNPLNSNVMQKIAKLELLESIKHLNVEESTDSLQIVEKEAVVPPNTLASVLVLLQDSEEEGHSPEMTWIQRDAEEHAAGEIEPLRTTDNFHSSPCAFSSDYTTMELFQQQMPQGSPANPAMFSSMQDDEEMDTVFYGQ
ncbi:interleukin-31 receptor subunit alpha isoform X2 [Hippoglossus stenolepis]|uniref:interleukin-31 receptor subunit alpha isoform X2 n=1 Tax=Hippoglossus stenolepis TaxID=195615 RepID=UPI00159C189E|nr:interleukin-31 receptor subunit alpha isoform X2 [Hippoglossus stenolepis]